MTIVEIYNNNLGNDLLEVNLLDILKCLQVKTLDLKWYILNVEAITKKDSPVNQSDFEIMINNSNLPYQITWEELINFDKMFEQFTNLLIVAVDEVFTTIDRKKGIGQYNDYEIVLQLFDSSYWIISSKIPALIENIRKKFSNVKDIRDLNYIISS